MLWPAAVARADITSTSYLALVAQDRQIDVQWSLALRDLEDAVGLDSNGDGEITWGELRAASDRITAYAHPRLRLTSAGIDCPAGAAQLLVDRLALAVPVQNERRLDVQHRGVNDAEGTEADDRGIDLLRQRPFEQ